MKLLKWKSWRISSRIILITVLPVALMFVSVTVYSYFSRYAEIRQDLDDRGNLIAAALAESSQYSVISGNLGEIDRSIRGLLQVDKGIFMIEILDADSKSLVKATNGSQDKEKMEVFEAAIKREIVDLNTFGLNEAPHVAASVSATAVSRPSDAVGLVRVTMSPSPMLANKRTRILIGSSIAGAALLFSAILGLYLALGLTRPLGKTIHALRHIREGKYAIQLDVTDGGEIGELQSTINEMVKSLDHYRLDMESKVAARTSALQEARDEAMKADAEKRRLIQKVTTAVEEERRNISVEIHDHMNALAIAARLQAERILDLATQTESQKSLEEASDHLNEIKLGAKALIKLTLNLYATARGIVKRLRPEVIDTLGLRDAIDEMVRHYDSLHSKCHFEFKSNGDFSSLKSDLAISAFRLVQEALSNTVKHADATICSVCLFLDEEANELRIRVIDNGAGFNPQTIEPGVGLIGMKERVFGAGGVLDISSEPSRGTTVTIKFPVVPDIKT